MKQSITVRVEEQDVPTKVVYAMLILFVQHQYSLVNEMGR